MKEYSEQTEYLLSMQRQYGMVVKDLKPPKLMNEGYDALLSLINRLLINHTDYLCEASCTVCGKGKQFDLETVRRMVTFVGSYPGGYDQELVDHIIHVEIGEHCLVCMFADGQLGDSIDMYKQTKSSNTLYGKYEIDI